MRLYLLEFIDILQNNGCIMQCLQCFYFFLCGTGIVAQSVARLLCDQGGCLYHPWLSHTKELKSGTSHSFT